MGLFYNTCTNKLIGLLWGSNEIMQLSKGVLKNVGQEHLLSIMGLIHTRHQEERNQMDMGA